MNWKNKEEEWLKFVSLCVWIGQALPKSIRIQFTNNINKGTYIVPPWSLFGCHISDARVVNFFPFITSFLSFLLGDAALFRSLYVMTNMPFTSIHMNENVDSSLICQLLYLIKLEKLIHLRQAIFVLLFGGRLHFVVVGTNSDSSFICRVSLKFVVLFFCCLP